MISNANGISVNLLPSVNQRIDCGGWLREQLNISVPEGNTGLPHLKEQLLDLGYFIISANDEIRNDDIIFYGSFICPLHVGIVRKGRVHSKMGFDYCVVEWNIDMCAIDYMTPNGIESFVMRKENPNIN